MKDNPSAVLREHSKQEFQPLQNSMAPSRARAGAAEEPNNYEKTRERNNAAGGRQKNRVSSIIGSAAGAKDNVSPASSNPPTGPTNGMSPSIKWANQSDQLLDSYRIAYKLDSAPAFHNTLSAAVLMAPGIGRRSPTMMKKRDKRKVPKEQLALAVRKHVNGLAVNESDVLVDFIYAVKNQDRKFKMKSLPGKK